MRSYGEGHLGDHPGGRKKVITNSTDKAFGRELIIVPEHELQKCDAAVNARSVRRRDAKPLEVRSAPFALPKLGNNIVE